MKTAMVKKVVQPLLLAVSLALLTAGHLPAQELGGFENEIPFGFRMSFFRSGSDSTRCLVTLTVDNRNLLFYRGSNYYEAHYEIFLSMREPGSRSILRGDWDKRVRVSSYDETNLMQVYDPLQKQLLAMPGKYEGFVEIKDMHANTYGNGRVSVTVPDMRSGLPKLSTPLFYDPGELGEGIKPEPPPPDVPLEEGSLKYPAGKPIFLLVEVYAGPDNLPHGWKLTAEVVKELMLFPRMEETVQDGLELQRRLLMVPTETMNIGTYEIEVALRDANNNTLARANSFKFRIIKSAEWIQRNVEDELLYLKYMLSDNELERLMALPREEKVKAVEDFWKNIDPVPATAVNELRVQYFERIDYANRNFTTEQTEGWDTDMGEVYIMLGPPTEIYGSRLNQIWVYERENIVLTFFGHNLRNRDVFDEYIRNRRWWKDSGESR